MRVTLLLNQRTQPYQLHQLHQPHLQVSDSIKTKLLYARDELDILQLIEDSADKPRTKQYDWYQWKTNGIAI